MCCVLVRRLLLPLPAACGAWLGSKRRCVPTSVSPFFLPPPSPSTPLCLPRPFLFFYICPRQSKTTAGTRLRGIRPSRRRRRRRCALHILPWHRRCYGFEPLMLLSNYGREYASGCWGKERVESRNMTVLSCYLGDLLDPFSAGPIGPLYT